LGCCCAKRICRDEIAVVLASGTQLKLKKKTWTVVGPLGADDGGFGDLYIVEDEASNEAVAKLVKKAPAADREALIGTANAAARHPNVVPVIDDGEHADKWVLVMPRAEISLSQYLDDRGAPLDPMEAVAVMLDVATALQALKGVVVHRDLKPANILLWNGAWSLTDFGLARYADEATGTETWKDRAPRSMHRQSSGEGSTPPRRRTCMRSGSSLTKCWRASGPLKAPTSATSISIRHPRRWRLVRRCFGFWSKNV
jgi:serine/threonine protein kinase